MSAIQSKTFVMTSPTPAAVAKLVEEVKQDDLSIADKVAKRRKNASTEFLKANAQPGTARGWMNAEARRLHQLPGGQAFSEKALAIGLSRFYGGSRTRTVKMPPVITKSTSLTDVERILLDARAGIDLALEVVGQAMREATEARELGARLRAALKEK